MTEKRGNRIAPSFAEGLGAEIRRLCAGRERVRRRFLKVQPRRLRGQDGRESAKWRSA